MNHFFVPQFIPKTLDELPAEPDEVTALVYLEDSISKELTNIREYHKEERPLGVPAVSEGAASELDDDVGSPLGSPSDDNSDFQASEEEEEGDDDEMLV